MDDSRHAYRRAHIGKIVSRKDGSPDFEEVSSSRRTRAETFPAWRSREEWQGFLDKLLKKWDGQWEKHR
ncbi:MAG: hypothetical protein K2W96_16155, partial [Gemmataceae bacterium]|nr:hypothetical protein [Gemmataceae bacterium]